MPTRIEQWCRRNSGLLMFGVFFIVLPFVPDDGTAPEIPRAANIESEVVAP